jgi:NADH-quinone oxidoreductase subunit G
VSLEVRHSAITERADVVFPVAPPIERAGTFINWEGRVRPTPQVVTTTALPDAKVLALLAKDMGVSLDVAELRTVHSTGLDPVVPPVSAPTSAAGNAPSTATGQAILASWHQLVDEGRCLDFEPYLAASAPPPVVRIGEALASQIGAHDGQYLTVRSSRGSVTLLLEIADVAPGVVWLPAKAPGCWTLRDIGEVGTIVSLSVKEAHQ